MGWEICAEEAYGSDTLDQINAQRAPGRFLLRGRQPVETLRYLTTATKDWAVPGLFYLVLAKWLTRLKSTRPLAYLRFGIEPEGISGSPTPTLRSSLIYLSPLRHMADSLGNHTRPGDNPRGPRVGAQAMSGTDGYSFQCVAPTRPGGRRKTPRC